MFPCQGQLGAERQPQVAERGLAEHLSCAKHPWHMTEILLDKLTGGGHSSCKEEEGGLVQGLCSLLTDWT